MLNDGHIKPVILQGRTPQETNPKGHWRVKSLFDQILVLAVVYIYIYIHIQIYPPPRAAGVRPLPAKRRAATAGTAKARLSSTALAQDTSQNREAMNALQRSTYASIYIYIYIYTHTYIYIYICICKYMCMYISMCFLEPCKWRRKRQRVCN